MARFTNPLTPGDWIEGWHGTFLSLVDQTATAINTEQLMKFEETYLSQGVTIENNSFGNPTRITFENPGVYNIQFSAQLLNTGGGGGTAAANIWLKHLEQNAPYSNTKIAVTANAPYLAAAWNWFVPATAGDYWQIAWSTNYRGIRIHGTAPETIHPGIPSIILTVNQVASKQLDIFAST